MIALYNALKFIIMLIFIQKISTLKLGVAFLKAESIYSHWNLNGLFARYRLMLHTPGPAIHLDIPIVW